MKTNKRSTMYIDCRHLSKINELEFLEEIHTDYFRIEPHLKRGLKKFMYEQFPEYAKENTFSLGWYNIMQIESIRDMKCSKIGKLVGIKGTVTKASEVRPELLQGLFSCALCGALTPLIEQ